MADTGIRVVYFEVYALDDEGWTLHARFPSEEKEVAMTEAKRIEGALGLGSRVVRRTYLPKSGKEKYAIVYSSRLTAEEEVKSMPTPPRLPTSRRRGKAPMPAGRRRGVRPARKPPATAFDAALRLVGIVILAALTAGFIAALFSLVAGDLVGDAATRHSAIFGIFVATFLLVAVPRVVVFSRDIEYIALDVRWPSRPPDGQNPKAAEPRSAAPPLPAIPTIPEMEPEPPTAAEEPDSPAATPDPPALPQPAILSDEDADDAGRAADGRTVMRPTAPPRLALMGFLESVVDSLSRFRSHLDAYDRFGLCLFVAGAGEEVARRQGLGDDGRRAMLREALTAVGAQPAVTEAFLEGYQDHLQEPRSLAMVQAGREAMARFTAGEGLEESVGRALEAWNRPSQAVAGPAIVAVVAARMPRSLGQAATEPAQAALRERGGKVEMAEDGRLLAFFPTTRQALEAAVALSTLASHRPRIGLDVGEQDPDGPNPNDPTALRAMENAERLSEVSAPGQVLCTSVVRGLGAQAGLRFLSHAAVEGFEGPIYEAAPPSAEESIPAEATAGDPGA